MIKANSLDLRTLQKKENFSTVRVFNVLSSQQHTETNHTVFQANTGGHYSPVLLIAVIWLCLSSFHCCHLPTQPAAPNPPESSLKPTASPFSLLD